MTVESGDRRCVVAQAKGDPDAQILATVESHAQSFKLKDRGPVKCSCDRAVCGKPNLHVYTNQGEFPILPNPKNSWVTMTYFMQNGGTDHARLDIYANKRLVARVAGLIGDSAQASDAVKFKFGNYRDTLPGTAINYVDRVCYSQNLMKCAKDTQVVP